MQKFWMVFNSTQGGKQMAHHPTLLSAKEEARRLCNSLPNMVFVVLEAKEYFKGIVNIEEGEII